MTKEYESQNLRMFFKKAFGKETVRDEDGFYHYLLENRDEKLIVDTTCITEWKIDETFDKLILSFDDDNLFSFTWFKDGKNLVCLNHSKATSIKVEIDTYEDEKGNIFETESIVIFLEDFKNKQLEIQVRPYLATCLRNNL